MKRIPKHPTFKGPSDNFTGDVYGDVITQPDSGVTVAAVHFTPGARTAWHSHEGGQTLYVTEGQGLVQSRGDKVTEIRPGDVLHSPDGEEHWHGAAPDHYMTHLSITQGIAHWGHHVTEAEYRGGLDP
jgi:quercetin dioxygenase-like cupin family protein